MMKKIQSFNNNVRFSGRRNIHHQPTTAEEQKHPSEGLLEGDAAADNEIDRLLALKLNKMTMEERSSGLHNLHGVANDNDLEEETPEMIQEKVEEMDRILSSLEEQIQMSSSFSSWFKSGDDKTDDDNNDSSSSSSSYNNMKAYKIAISMSKEYVHRLKITCLRAECYNCQEATNLLIRFFDRKMELFGQSCLVREIQLEDLNDEDMKVLRSGCVQLLPYRDRAGRAVFLMHGKTNVTFTTVCVTRVFFYMVMTALQDEETQFKGAVAIYYGVGQTKTVPGRPNGIWKNFIAMPWRVVGYHYCVNTSVKNDVLFSIVKFFQKRVVGRFRLHQGSDTECIYNLLTFGIPKEAIPITTDGKMDLSSHHATLKMIECRHRRRNNNVSSSSTTTATSSLSSSSSPQNITTSIIDSSDDSPSTSSFVEQEQHESKTLLIPGPMDMVIGKKESHNNNIKNRPTGVLRFHCLVDEYRERYEASSRSDKTIIAERILYQMKKSGCRFLSPAEDGTGYVVCHDEVAREKISHRFRNLRQKSRRQQKAKGGNTKNMERRGTTTTTTTTTRKRNKPSENKQVVREGYEPPEDFRPSDQQLLIWEDFEPLDFRPSATTSDGSFSKF